ncbi:TPA: TIGR02594 family protein [Enterobacter kobei]|nr:TIGR02594 family protein [Enterobacter kobei]
MTEPKWLTEARQYIGEREIKGPDHNPLIVQFWKDINRSGIKDDETPWCAAFAGAVLERTGIRSSRFESARSYLDWGDKLTSPALGCIVVFCRAGGGGHVGFAVGQTPDGNLLVLGGNQSDAVNIRQFPLSRVTGYRWPSGVPDIPQTLPCTAEGIQSASEA